MNQNQLPSSGYVRLTQILGNKKSNPAVPPIIPIGKSTWWAGIQSGRFPKPIKCGRMTFWKVEDIRALIQKSEF